jgi:hypothetical protein
MPTWDDVVQIGSRFPGVEVTTSYGTPSGRSVDGNILVSYRRYIGIHRLIEENFL